MTAEPQADPGGTQSAIGRYRDLAKFLIGIFASIGALLVAGTQLSSLGKLTWEHDRGRLLAAGLTLSVAVAAVLWIVRCALVILQPVEMSLDEVVAHTDLAAAIDARPSLLGGADCVADVKAQIGGPQLTDEERDAWLAVAQDVVDRAAFLQIQRAFHEAWIPMTIGAVVGTAAIAAFAWAANPPDDGTADPVVRPAPVAISISLSSQGRDVLEGSLGRACVSGRISALAIGGSESAPRVVTLRRGRCKSAQFVLSSDWGAARPSP